MALTASADSGVQELIQSSLHLASPVIVSKGLDRPNVFISVGEIKGYNVSVRLNPRNQYMIDSVIVLPCISSALQLYYCTIIERLGWSSSSSHQSFAFYHPQDINIHSNQEYSL